MRAKMKPSFKVDGKTYEFTYTRSLQCEYKRMTDEKKQDTVYQDELAEYMRLQSKYERMHAAYINVENELIQAPKNKKLQRDYASLESLEKKAFREFSNYTSAHPNCDGSRFAIDCLEKLVIYALTEQHGLSEKDAEAVWCQYVTENGEARALLFLTFVGTAWFTDTSEGEDTPFIKAKIAKLEAANNRRIGLRKINK